MWTIFWRTIKDRRTLLLIYTLSSIALLWMYIALFPAFKDQAKNLEELMKSYPESFLKAFNFDINAFSTIEGFLSTEQYSFVWPLMLIFMMVGFAGFSLAGEVEKGTVELLLSQPISRAKVFLSRYLAGLSMLAVFVFFSIFSTIPISQAYDINVMSETFLSGAILAFIFGLAIYSIGMFFSAIFSDKGKVFFISGVILIVMYVLNILASIKESLSDLRYASFFYYFNPTKALVYNEIDQWAYLVFLGTAFVLTILGLIIFSRKNIAT